MWRLILIILVALVVEDGLAQSGPDEFIFRYQGEVVKNQSFSFDPLSPSEDCSSELRGTVYFDDTTSQFCFCNGTAWCIIGGDCATSSSCEAVIE